MDRVFSFSQTVFKSLSVFFFLSILIAVSSLKAGTPDASSGIVTAGSLQMRSSPEEAAPSIKRLPKNARVRILYSKNNWLRIEYEGKIGFVLKAYIRYDKTSTTSGTDSEAKLEALTQKAKKLDSKLELKKKEVDSFSDQEKRMIESLNAIESDLNTLENQTLALQKEVAVLTAELKKVESDFNLLNKELKELEDYASRRLVSLYKLSRIGTLPLLISAESIYELLVRKKNMQRLIAHDETIWRTLSEKRTATGAVQKELQLKQQVHQEKVEVLATQTRNLTRKRAERKSMLTKIRDQKTLALAAMTSLKQAAEALDHQIIEAARQPPPPPPPPSKPSPPPEPSENSRSTENAESTARSTPAVSKKSVDEFKGLLNMPVKGKIISFFGPYSLPHTNLSGFRSGIDIQAPIGEPIRAVKGGTTLFAGWFKGYGNMVILDHGDSYYTVYTHAQELYKTKGEAVNAGEIIGTVGDTCSLDGPKLHFEIRHHGKPVDPLNWIEKRSLN